MTDEVCPRCSTEFDPDEHDALVCNECLEKALRGTLEELGQPMILDEEERILYIPKAKIN